MSGHASDMATVRNKTNKPLRVHIASGKVLHLGPRNEGRISDHDLDHRGVRVLVDAGELEIVGGGPRQPEDKPGSVTGHEETHGHHPDTSLHRRGDR